MKNLKYIIPIVTVLIMLVNFTIYYNNKEEKFKEISKNVYSENIKNPDRIIYKPSNEDKYYEILPNEELYNQIIQTISENIGELNKKEEISQERIDEIHKDNSYLEFDYNRESKNYIIPINAENIGVIKLKSEGGTVLNSRIKHTRYLKRYIDKYIKENERKSYTMNTNQEYVSKNVVEIFPYRYKQEFKEIDYTVYQKIITNWEDYELYKAMCQLEFDELLPEDIFDDNVLVLTMSMPSKVSVKISIGNLKYTYDSDENSIYSGYRAHLLKVSKIVNTNCIYNTNLVLQKQEEARAKFNAEYNNKVENIDTDVFVTDFEEYTSAVNTDILVSESKAKEIADKAFEEAARIAGEYDKSTQTMKKEYVYANNFFTAKYTDSPRNYGSKKIQAYVFTREDEMGNGISIYVDVNTGKVIGGKAFGD